MGQLIVRSDDKLALFHPQIMTAMRRLKENSLAKKVLLQIGESCVGLLEAGGRLLFDWDEVVKGWSLYSDYTLFPRGIAQLKKSGHIVQNKNKFYLTAKGRIEIIRTLMKEKRYEKKKWDGKWRAIIFDIPELNRRERRFLRDELRWIGFVELQKSVWIFPYEIEKELLVLLKLWRRDFRGDIRFLRIEKLGGAEKLKRHFSL